MTRTLCKRYVARRLAAFSATLATLMIGSSQLWAQFPNDFKFGESSDFSVGMWINFSADQSTDVSLISNKNWASGNNPGYIMTLDGSEWKVNASTDAGPRLDTGLTPLTTSSWHYVVMTVDRTSGQILAYTNAGTPLGEVDSELIGTGSFDTWSATPGLGLDLNIAQDGTGAYDGGQSYHGLMDDAAIWNRVLSANEISYVYNQGLGGSDLGSLFGTTAPGAGATINTGLVGYYDFEGNANDSTGRGNDGAWKSGAGGSADYASALSGFGQGADFDGLAYVTIGESPEAITANWTGASSANNDAANAANWSVAPAAWNAGTEVVVAQGTTAFGNPPGAGTGPMRVQAGDDFNFGNALIGSTTQTTYVQMTGGTMTGQGSSDSVIGVEGSTVEMRLSGTALFNHAGDAEESSELDIARSGASVNIEMSGGSRIATGYGVADATHATGFRRPISGETLPRTGDDLKVGHGGDATLVMNNNTTIFVPDVMYANDATSGVVNVTQNDNSKVIANWDTRWFDTSGHTADQVTNWAMNDNSEFRVARDHGLGEADGDGTINLTINDNAKFTAGDRIVLGAGGGNVNVVVNGGTMKVGGNSETDVLLVDETGGDSEPAIDWILHMGGGANAKLTVNDGLVEIGRSAFIGAGGGNAVVTVNGGTFRTLGVGPSGTGLGNDPGGGVAGGVDWTNDLGGGEVVLARDAGDVGTLIHAGGDIEVSRAMIVGFGGDGKLTLHGQPAGAPSSSFVVHGELGFGGFSLNSAGGTGTLEVVLDSGGITPVVVDNANPNLNGDVTIYSGSQAQLGMAADYRPAPGANQGTHTLVQYAGNRLNGGSGSGQFNAVDARAEWGVDYSIVYNDAQKKIDLNLDFVYAPGDTNFNHQVTAPDINAIVSAGKFNQGPTAATWAQGDFDNNDRVDSTDIQMVLAANAYNKGDYTAGLPGTGDPIGSEIPSLTYNPATGNLAFNPAGLDVNGFILTSESEAFTGAAANLPSSAFSAFNVDDDGEISAAFTSIAATLNLGNVVGSTIANPLQDLLFTYTVQNFAGVFGGENANQLGLIVIGAPGDFDGDGDVDGADFVVWQTNFPSATGATLATGDADGDGDVDGADFVIWQTNFPFTPGAGASPVPEPNASLLALLGFGSGLFLRRAWRGNRRINT